MSEYRMTLAEEPEAYVREACRWVRKHPDRFKRLMRIVHREVDRGNPNVQRGDVYKLARDTGFEVSECDELRRDHNLWAVLARYMVMLRPRLARSISFRRAGCDEVDLEAVWREEVNAGTTFLAASWQAAKRACEDGCVSAA